MIQVELSGKIIGAGMDVVNGLRAGLDDLAGCGTTNAQRSSCLSLIRAIRVIFATASRLWFF
jgi:hypothetical protein